MKKNVIVFGLILSAAIMSCNSKNGETDATVMGTDSSMMAAGNTNAPMGTTDTSSTKMADATVLTDTMGAAKVAMAKPDPSKKGKKGKVSITMFTPVSADMSPDKDGFYTNAEVLPAFPGGPKGLEKYFEDNLQYPVEASDNGVEGVVNINFAVDENGKVYSPRVTSDNVGYGVEQEALRVFNKMPKWTPGKIKGKNVKTRFTLPVRFQLY